MPRVAHVLAPEDGLGCGLVASREPGEALGRRIVADPALQPIRPALAGRCGTVLAAIHGVPIAGLPPLATMADAFARGDRSIERAAVGRRACEAELELLIAMTKGSD